MITALQVSPQRHLERTDAPIRDHDLALTQAQPASTCAPSSTPASPRHGRGTATGTARGLRGSVVTDEVRLAWTTAERFDDVATAAVTRLDK